MKSPLRDPGGQCWTSTVGSTESVSLRLFRDNDIDGKLLHELTGDDLKDIGVAPFGHRKKLLEAIASLGAAPEAVSTPRASPADAAERRHLTVMFVDLVGSTTLSTQLDPEDMCEVIRAYQNAVAGKITRFEGTLRSSRATACSAYFGWPMAREEDAERAVRADWRSHTRSPGWALPPQRRC